MDVQPISEKQEMNSVAQALLNIFSNQVQGTEDHSLSLFLMKLYKNNVSAKPKKMNSIRLSRFNAFLYRVSSNYPRSAVANSIIHSSLIAVLSNDRSFLEEQDQETVISIAKWTCKILQDNALNGYHQSVYVFLKFLLTPAKPEIEESNVFDECIRNEPYFNAIELSSEDQLLAREHRYYSITSAFNIKDYILSELRIKEIYTKLYTAFPNKKLIAKIFHSHIEKINLDMKVSELFLEIFFPNSLATVQEIQVILQSLEQNYFNHQDVNLIIEKFVQKFFFSPLFFELKLTGKSSQLLLLQSLNIWWKSIDATHLIDSFLNCPKINNLSILYFLVNSEPQIPKKYMLLPFELSQEHLQYKHTLIFALTLAQYNQQNDKKIITELIDLFLQHQKNLASQQKTLIIKAIHYCISIQDKRLLYANIINQANVSNICGQPSLSFLPLRELKNDKVTGYDKKKLLKILQSHQDSSESGTKVKAELLGLCNHTTEHARKIKELNKIFTKPYEEILRYVNREYGKTQAEMVGALLMGLNNKLYLTFIPEPSNDIVSELSSYFISLHHSFAKNFAKIQKYQPEPQISQYYAALFRYSFHSRRKVGSLGGEIGELLSGVCNYRRVNGTDFAEYLIAQDDKKSISNELWTGRKLMFQLRTLCQNILNFNNTGGSEPKKELVHILEKAYIFELGFKLIKAYFQVEANDVLVLTDVLKIVKPKYQFLLYVQKTFSSQCEQYPDILSYTPELLKQVYSQTINFISLIVDSSTNPLVEDQDKNKMKKKKSEKDRNKKNIINLGSNEYIFNNDILFETLSKKKELPSLLGDSSALSTFNPLINILSKINDTFNRLQKAINEWVPTIKIFHCPKIELFDQWMKKVISYCDLWHFFIVQKKYKFQIKELERHFHILSEFLNALYESKKQVPQAEERILVTLLLIYQSTSTNKTFEQPEIPIQPLKNLFLGYRISTPSEHHYYQCFTCNLQICQICLPFLHKHHDVNYLGKDGVCVHDSNQRKKGEKEDQKSLRQREIQQRDAQRIQRQLERYQNLSNLSFQPSSYSQGLMRNPRREQDWLMSTFQLPQEQSDFNQHLRMNNNSLGFKQMIEVRQREQRERERQRQKQLLFSRQRQRMQKQRQQIQIVNQKEPAQQKSQIKSCSSKSIKNLHYGQTNRQYFIPQFTPLPEPQGHYPLNIDTKPLMCILLRQLQCQGSQDSQKQEKGKINISVSNQRYNFFNKSNYFKGNPRPQFGMMRGIGIGLTNLTKKNLLTSNHKFLAYPTPNNGVIFLNLATITNKMQKRIQTRTLADFEQQRGYLAGSINNSNFSFQPFQILFNKNNPNILAIIGLTQVGFAVINNDGKLIKYADSDFKSSEPITKFIWLHKHKNIFAVASGNNVRLGHVSDQGRVKTTTRFKVQIDKSIRDFEINNENGVLFLYIIDNQGALYRAEFNYRSAKPLNISDKTLNYIQRLNQLQSLIFADKKIFLTSSSGKCYLLNVEKASNPTFAQTFDVQSILRGNDNAKFIKFPTYLSQLQLIQTSESVFSIACLLKRTVSDPKKKGGHLCVVRINSKNTLDLTFLYEEETIQSYEILELGENSYVITAVDENGSVFCFPYQIPAELFNPRDETKILIDENSIKLCNRHVKTNNLLGLVKYCQPKRYQNFKETKDITAVHKIAIDHPYSIKVTSNEPNKYFWTGVCFTVQGGDQQTEIIFDLFGRHYVFEINKSRQIQIGFNIKETIDIFTSDNELAIFFHVNSVKQIKNFRIYGLDYAAESLYKRAYTQLHKIIITHLQFTDNSIQHYLQNADRHCLLGLDINKFVQLKNTQKYLTKETNLLMKLQLLRESISNDLLLQNGIEQSLDVVRTYLLPQCQKRQYLEKSCWKLIRRICQLALPQSKGLTGHPFQYRTVLDLYYFEVCFAQWSNSHQINHFQQLVNVLYALIFKRIGNLYIIFKLYPGLIYELTYFYKGLLQSLKLSKAEPRDQAQLHKLINICPNFVALICEYYQTLKNTSNQMVQQSQEQKQSAENIILSLLEEVFCATRKELYREVFISPQVYLQKLYLSRKQLHPLQSAISIFEIQDKKQDHSLLKKNNCVGQEQIENQKQQDYLQLDQESQKEVVLEEQAREMVEPSSQLQDASNEMDVEKPSSQQKFKQVSWLLKNNLLSEGAKLRFTYYQFSFEMSTALFTLSNYINEQNAVFYIGFLFNLLRILEMNLEPSRDAQYIKQLFDAILNKIYSEKHSVLFMVVNYFFQPQYQTKPEKKRQIRPSKSKLSHQFVKYLFTNNISIESLFLNFNPTKIDKIVSFGQAMKFNSFSISNHLYQLKFLGNLYFNVRVEAKFVATQAEAFKYKILGGVVQYKLRVLSNIMYYEEWQEGLQEARVQVGFDTLATNFSQAISMLAACSKSQPAIFIKKLNENPSKIKILQDLLQSRKGEQMQILEMLTTYYAS